MMKNQQQELVLNNINESVLSVIGSTAMQGFTKAFIVAEAISNLNTLLTPEYMKPIMALQGNRLGFKTDKDKNGGYPEAIVKNCLIEAVLMGLEPTGNQFNIISGNTYPTKEGLKHLLDKHVGLDFTIICELPKVNAEKSGAAVQMLIKWTINGTDKSETINIPIKIDQYTSVDAIIGKATRKGRAWLYSKVVGTEITDGEVEDAEAKVVSSKHKKTKEQVEMERMMQMLNDVTSLDELDLFTTACPDCDIELINQKRFTLKS
jgi:hypothetical protein